MRLDVFSTLVLSSRTGLPEELALACWTASSWQVCLAKLTETRAADSHCLSDAQMTKTVTAVRLSAVMKPPLSCSSYFRTFPPSVSRLSNTDRHLSQTAFDPCVRYDKPNKWAGDWRSYFCFWFTDWCCVTAIDRFKDEQWFCICSPVCFLNVFTQKLNKNEKRMKAVIGKWYRGFSAWVSLPETEICEGVCMRTQILDDQ